jgi:hypothetical protein
VRRERQRRGGWGGEGRGREEGREVVREIKCKRAVKDLRVEGLTQVLRVEGRGTDHGEEIEQLQLVTAVSLRA